MRSLPHHWPRDQDRPGLAEHNQRARPRLLLHFIQKPDELLAAKDPLATSLFKQYKEIQMPNVRLGPDDTESIVRFLERQSATKATDVPSITKVGEEEKHPEKTAPAN
jgi:hypothetical protein